MHDRSTHDTTSLTLAVSTPCTHAQPRRRIVQRRTCLIASCMRHFRISAYPRPPPAACMSVTMRGPDVLEPGSVLLQDGTWLTAPVRCPVAG